MDIDLTPRLKESMATKPRVRGRYSSSEVYAILNGWTTPEQWFRQPEKQVKDMLNMWRGTGIHNQLEALMGAEHSEIKKEFPYKDITLVGKIDFLPPHKPDEIWEFKTSEKTMQKAKPWALHQVKLYTTMFERDNGLIYQPVSNANGLYLRHLGTAKRDDKWFYEQLDKLYAFHLQVERFWEVIL